MAIDVHFKEFKRSRFVICDWWISIRFYFKVPCLCASCFGQLSTCLLRFFWSFLIRNVFLGLTCNNKEKSSPFPSQKYHRDFLRYWAVKSYPQFLLLPNPGGQNGNNMTSSKHLLHSRFLLPLKNNFLPLSAHIKTFWNFID